LYITDFFARSNGVPPTKLPSAALPAGVLSDVPLAPHTTLGVGGLADYFATVEDGAHLQSLLVWARQHELPVFMLGEGSNVVVHDRGFRGLVLWQRPPDGGIAVHQASGEVSVTLAGGTPWCQAVQQLAGEGLYGVEALNGIPGTCGAAPVQNIGAYGQELSQTLTAIEVVELQTGAATTLGADACGLGYRQSHLRHLWAGRYVVTAIHLRLGQSRQRPLTYPALLAALERQGLHPTSASPQAVAQTVWQVRAGRGMVWQGSNAPFGTVGSFFINPTVAKAHSAKLLAQYPHMPRWPGATVDKLSAAWLMETAGFTKGWRSRASGGRVGTSPLHALALINAGGATASEICQAATEIYEGVLAHTGVALRAEAQRVGFGASQAPFG
jgi:UDP-N-acetylmuramate dehydrogenase